MVLGGPGVIEELTARGVDTVKPEKGQDPGAVDAVVVGMDPLFDYESLAAATVALHAGARLIGTNDDATFPAPGAVLPGAGSLLAAVARAGQTEPIIAGKPYPADGRLGARADRRCRDGRRRPPFDRRAAGSEAQDAFGLVLTGVTPSGHGPIDPEPDFEAPDLLGLVHAVLG